MPHLRGGKQGSPSAMQNAPCVQSRKFEPARRSAGRAGSLSWIKAAVSIYSSISLNKGKRAGRKRLPRNIGSIVLQSVVALFAGTDLYDVLDVVKEDLAVADIAGIKSFLGRFNGLPYRDFADDDLDLNLG